MRQIAMSALDRFVPRFIKGNSHSEEQDKARAYVVQLLVAIAAMAAAICAYYLSDSIQGLFSQPIVLTLYAALACFGVAYAWFWRTGRFGVSGNIFGLTVYATTLMAALNLPEQHFLPTLILLLALPALVAQTVGFVAGAVWQVVVMTTPLLVSLVGLQDIDGVWLSTWLLTSLGLLFSIYIGHYYRENMVGRLRNERAHFEFAAAHDPLTGLPNRLTFDHRFKVCLRDCQRTGQSAVLVFIDLNGFKPINDIHGHQVGDLVLVAVAKRLARGVRRNDTVFRLGGDEFAMLLENCTVEGAQRLVKIVHDEVRKPIEIGGLVVSVSCALGVVCCPGDGVDAKALYQLADQRMYEDKRESAEAGLAEKNLRNGANSSQPLACADLFL